MKHRTIITGTDYKEIDSWLNENGCKRILLVCRSAINLQKSFAYYINDLKKNGLELFCYSGFQANPIYENIIEGIRAFKKGKCDSIIAAGGGSAIDVAKCIKAYAGLEESGENGSFLKYVIKSNDIPLLAIPTTAGSGSETTRYAVIYYQGQKQSITSDYLVPDAVFMNPDMLISLPLYQKKATMMDALCHGIESLWSVNSTEESKKYSVMAIKGVIENMEGYLKNTLEGRTGMLIAANNAGKAINIAQTTAGHAMCYKITEMFGCAHGHAAILCNRVLFSWIIENADKCIDPRGHVYLKKTLDEIGRALGCNDAEAGADKLIRLFNDLMLKVPAATEEQFKKMKISVNSERLKNNPIVLDIDTLDMLYHEVLDIEN